MLLDKIRQSSDMKGLKEEEYPILAQEIRQFLIEKISLTGGHLASNLGVVELTMALHLAFDLPKDKIVWDVGHQSYTHKLLSGRKAGFDDLRQLGGMSGFPKRKESPYDVFDTGHSSTSISAGLGIAQARELLHETYSVISVIGDGALTGGMAYEALNNAAQMKKNFIIVLNDNEMSISENVGGMSKYLSNVRTQESYADLKRGIDTLLSSIPVVGKGLSYGLYLAKNGIKQFFVPGMLFEDMDITYLGPVDGHNVKEMVRVFKEAKRVRHAVLVHVVTTKGKGYAPAEKNPARFHGVEPFDVATGKPLKEKVYPGYTDVFSRKICELAEKDPSIVAITAAMPDGTGLSRFAKHFPERFFDVGIAEAHAVTSAAGMASAGLRPVVAVYSSFLQRGYDQVLHDVCIQGLPVLFAIDRAGLVGSDGETHQGIFDVSFLSLVPGMSIMAPKNLWELQRMLEFGVTFDGPLAIRYPRGQAYRGLKEFAAPVEYGKAEMLYEESEIALFALGSMVSTGEHVREKLKARGYACTLVNARFVKPLDTKMLDRLCRNHRLIVTMEENVLRGGMGMCATRYIHENNPQIPVIQIALPDAYVEHGNVTKLREMLGIDSDSVLRRILEVYPKARVSEEE
ncbi:MAG: 1-deoxy-D-xylulose-5-phosphate synthase [Lachnospiraceae bacterium]|jgi:1-deoxy-D-xylulose-5-phosphate synthase|nr:1-deoxy-D-xylulose-5-phosphate synthase [Lachnospiraceae bacterium]NBJ83694.1 1-deoxy-D-xylulose-5-phosphate synthase [bacterium 1XD42-76]NBK06949.1 1-deoxy-D-xylulose-5-phosphate synthase [bacterium 1XD42-94]